MVFVFIVIGLMVVAFVVTMAVRSFRKGYTGSGSSGSSSWWAGGGDSSPSCGSSSSCGGGGGGGGGGGCGSS